MNNWSPSKIVKKTKRFGRGKSSGRGKTAGRGMSGQKSRTGENTGYFEGGQTKLGLRLPKARGFKSKKRTDELVITSDKLNQLFAKNKVVGKAEILEKLGPKAKNIKKVKIIKGKTELNVTLKDDVLTSRSISTKDIKARDEQNN